MSGSKVNAIVWGPRSSRTQEVSFLKRHLLGNLKRVFAPFHKAESKLSSETMPGRVTDQLDEQLIDDLVNEEVPFGGEVSPPC